MTQAATPPAPRWFKITLVVFALLLVGFVVVHLLGGGMGNHLAMQAADEATASEL